MVKVSISPFQLHRRKWESCTLCPLHETRQRVCIARGSLPCDVLFIGEAPGVSEDVFGQPFVGPAGKLLDQMIANSLRQSGKSLKLAFTNLVGCIPLEEEEDGTTAKTEEPSEESIEACAPRLTELVHIAKPRAIVTVGKLSKKHVSGQAQFSLSKDGSLPWLKGEFLKFIDVIHPAWILRADVSQKGLAIQRCIAHLTDLFEEL